MGVEESRERRPVRPEGRIHLPKGSILYLSLTIAQGHPLAPLFRRQIDPGPEADLGRIIDSSGPWIRGYFRNVIRAPELDFSRWKQELEGVRGIVAGGSFHSWVTGKSLAPWQGQTIHALRYALCDQGIPFLGLCGGAQAATRALGGTVEPNPESAGLGADFRGLVIGSEQLHRTAAGYEDPIFAGCHDPLYIQAIHGDCLAELPPRATLLASTEEFSHRVVAVGDRVRLFQPHPEMSLDYARRILAALCPHIAAPAKQPQLQAVLRTLRPTTEINRRVVANFLDMCAGLAP